MKWHGELGFATSVETTPGVWVEKITTRKTYGEIRRSSRRLYSSPDKVNDDITISNSISVVADPYIQKNIYSIRYADFMGAKWKVTDIEVEYPRIILTLGGLYNGETENGTPGYPGGAPWK